MINQSASAGGCDNSWTQDDAYYASWGFSLAYNIPEIYLNLGTGETFSAQAIQWERIVRYAALNSRTMSVFGVMVQAQACIDNLPPYNYDPADDCNASEDNTPTEGYDQLWNALNYIDGGSGAQTPPRLTNISWLQ